MSCHVQILKIAIEIELAYPLHMVILYSDVRLPDANAALHSDLC